MAAVGPVVAREDAFRKLFRFYRRREGADLTGVIDFSTPVVTSQLSDQVSDQDAYRAGLQPVKQWGAYGLKGYPGEVHLCRWSPSKINGAVSTQVSKGSRKQEPKTLLEKLRWVTLGYHYNWDSKKYSADHHTPFPGDLAFLSGQVASACGFQSFQAEAGILNYYHFDSSLGIHVDESELDHSQPLISFSFGQSSIFLLGGLKQDEAPTAMFIHSGDIMVMSGFSRLLYHAIPRVLPNPEGRALPSCLEQTFPTDLPDGSVVDPCSEEDWQACTKYLHTSRINMTIRQVLAVGQSFPAESTMDKGPDTTSSSSYHQNDSKIKQHKPHINS
uniref:Nucleic acid dioxygenase ALKBH1 n=1 Tax=Sphenodon punctatus TaxID=8508 RepID=A0A8D0GUF6_SPHPU